MAQFDIQVDDELKRKAEQVCSDIGISLNTAINIFIEITGNKGYIPFDISNADI